jgi:hypothetical protein
MTDQWMDGCLSLCLYIYDALYILWGQLLALVSVKSLFPSID